MKGLYTPIVLALLVGWLVSCKETVISPDRIMPDTTSHDFFWTIDTLGDGNASLLNDVLIIDAENVLAVGAIYLKDSIGDWESPYAVARWDGSHWNLMHLYHTDNTLIAEIREVISFGASDFWLADGGVERWDGSSSQVSASYSRLDLIGGTENGQSINRLWGTSSSNLYGVGWKGMVAHFDGNTWQKLPSSTLTDFQDIFGATDPGTGQTTIMALASFANFGSSLTVFSIQGESETQVDTAGLSLFQSSIWLANGGPYLIAGDGVFLKNSLADVQWKPQETILPYYARRIRGSSKNDIFVAGDFGLLAHYNGATWCNYTNGPIPPIQGIFLSVAIKGNTVVAVGIANDKAIAAIGRR